MYKVVYKNGSFTDFKGTKVNFILAAVSIPSENVVLHKDEDDEVTTIKCDKYLSIGVSVLREGDTYNEAIGKEIAYGKAVTRKDHVLFTSDAGLINNVMVNAILEQEAAYMQVNPGRYIASYDEARDNYLKAKAKQEYLDSLTDEEKQAINVAATVKDREKFISAVEDKRKELAITSISNNSSN